MYWDVSTALPSIADKILSIYWLQYPLISKKNQFLILSSPIFLYKNINEDRVNKKNCYYFHFSLTCLLTMSHSDLLKWRMICTIEAWTEGLAIKCTSLYKNWLEIIILLFTPFEMNNTYLYVTHYMQEYSIEVYSDWNYNSINHLSLVTCNNLSHHMSMYRITLRLLDLPVGTSNLAILRTHYGYIIRAHVPRGTQHPHRWWRN